MYNPEKKVVFNIVLYILLINNLIFFLADVKPAKKDAGFNAGAGSNIGGSGIGNNIGGMNSGIGGNVGSGSSGNIGFNLPMGSGPKGVFGLGQGSGGLSGPPKGPNSFGSGIDHFNNTNDGFNKRDQNFTGGRPIFFYTYYQPYHH